MQNQDEAGPNGAANGDCDSSACRLLNARNDANSISPGTKSKRKARSTRRRLNALMNNTSLHFSDTDSEGELTAPRVSTHAKRALNVISENNLLNPVISVTLDGSDDSSYGGDRRNSYVDNHTDVDEIYTSEPENNGFIERRKSRAISPRGNLAVAESPLQGDTDLEEVSNDEEEVVQTPIYVQPRSDILCDFNGETITTKEGDGPFSIEVRNQMSFDHANHEEETADTVVMPTTDSEDMEASDEDGETEETCDIRHVYEDFDLLTASQIVMKNVSKTEQHLLAVQEPENGISDSHTDLEDLD